VRFEKTLLIVEYAGLTENFNRF